MNEDDIRAQVRQRISAIMGSQEAKGATNLAEHFAYVSEMSVEDAIGALKAFHTDIQNASRRTSPSPSQSWEDRKRAAGAIGLAPLDTEASNAVWDRATADAHRFRGIEDPEVGATGRKLQ